MMKNVEDAVIRAMNRVPEVADNILCALTSKSEPLVPRYFSLEPGDAHRTASPPPVELRGVRRVVSGPSLAVEVELVALEETRRGPGSIARVTATFILHDERFVRAEKTLTVDVPVEHASAPDHADQTVHALGLAMSGIVSRIADEICRQPAAVAAR